MENSPYVLRVLLARPRLWSCLVTGFLTAFFIPQEWVHQWVTRAIIGWNVGALVYLVLAAKMMFWSSLERMHARAMQEDDGKFLVLMLVVTSAMMCVGAIVAELSVVKDLTGDLRHAHVALAALTLATSWTFTQVMFALHYAHDFYVSENHGETGGLKFPGTATPDYADFLYFAIVIGTSAQTADVSFSSRKMRRTGILHCVLAFFFNTTLLALTINIASSLF
ncbi:DUF1345 domain-containing protein [Rhodoferax sp.]|uniref:DUF1345 domain-containing protein n=1 Tax=Rhodoferax sp. TaxID=50421 RepID=UPI002848AC7A|nr:DUF1345 domain-containing protein [Rhodoferax sp.]MDR3368379.1 DUF1345 domain-containing protein [Rhodoferax sp.]